MKTQYNKLWKILIDKNMNKVQLREVVGISSKSLANSAITNLSAWMCS